MAFASQDVPHREVDVSLMPESTMSSSNHRRSIAEQKALPVAEADLDIMNLDGHDESNSSSSSLFSSNPDQNDVLSNSTPSSNPVEVNEFETLDNSDADRSNTNTEFAVIISRSVLTQDHAKRTQESIKRDFQTMMPGLSPTGFKFAEQYSKKEAYEIRQQYGILEFVVITFSTRREQMVTVKGLDGKVADFREIKFHERIERSFKPGDRSTSTLK